MPIGIGAAILGSAAVGMAGSAYANWRNRVEAKKNRSFQRQMSNTAHRRQMADLKKAGINPLLTGKYGGASQPSGAVAQQENIAEGIPQSAQAFATIRAQNKLVAAQESKTNTETLLLQQQLGQKKLTNPVELKQVTAQLQLTKNASAKVKADIRHVNKQIKVLTHELHKLAVTRKLWDAANKLTPSAQSIVDKIKRLKDPYHGARPEGTWENPYIGSEPQGTWESPKEGKW